MLGGVVEALGLLQAGAGLLAQALLQGVLGGLGRLLRVATGRCRVLGLLVLAAALLGGLGRRAGIGLALLALGGPGARSALLVDVVEVDRDLLRRRLAVALQGPLEA